MSIFRKVLRAGEGKKVRALQALVPDINGLESEMQALSDEALRGKTGEFRSRLTRGEALDDLLIEAFAVSVVSPSVSFWPSVATMSRFGAGVRAAPRSTRSQSGAPMMMRVPNFSCRNLAPPW